MRLKKHFHLIFSRNDAAGNLNNSTPCLFCLLLMSHDVKLMWPCEVHTEIVIRGHVGEWCISLSREDVDVSLPGLFICGRSIPTSRLVDSSAAKVKTCFSVFCAKDVRPSGPTRMLIGDEGALWFKKWEEAKNERSDQGMSRVNTSSSDCNSKYEQEVSRYLQPRMSK